MRCVRRNMSIDIKETDNNNNFIDKEKHHYYIKQVSHCSSVNFVAVKLKRIYFNIESYSLLIEDHDSVTAFKAILVVLNQEKDTVDTHDIHLRGSERTYLTSVSTKTSVTTQV